VRDAARQSAFESPYDGYRAESTLGVAFQPPCGRTGRSPRCTPLIPAKISTALFWLFYPSLSLILMRPHLRTIVIPQGTVLLQAGDEFDKVYFPHNGMISLLVLLENRKSVEIATVGREGVVGAMAGLGIYRSLVRVVVQLSMSVSTISAAQFRKAAANSQAISNLCIQYNEVLLSQARISAACNAANGIEARLCRWLLQSADRAASNTVRLTQDFLVDMLGTLGRRRDQTALEHMSCECYRSMVMQASRGTL
jgi:CRP-like cAMP-binding protein